MNKLYKKINNNYPSIRIIESYISKKYKIKNSRNEILTNENIKLMIRRKNAIFFNFIVKSGYIDKFKVTGSIYRKKKKNNINNSITTEALISGVNVKINFNLFSPVIRLN